MWITPAVTKQALYMERCGDSIKGRGFSLRCGGLESEYSGSVEAFLCL